jgi:RimJ/RimL family protein N-acetyltransferase
LVNNEAALALHRKMGFGIEGRKKHSLLINGSYVDEYWMAKLLS